jgi:hypothetical protein
MESRVLTELLQGVDPSGGTAPSLLDALVNVGGIGLVAAIFLYATGLLYRHNVAATAREITRLEESHRAEIARLDEAHSKEVARIDAAYGKEVDRGNRLEVDLSGLNKLINTSLAGELVRATEAIREAAEMMRDHRRP